MQNGMGIRQPGSARKRWLAEGGWLEGEELFPTSLVSANPSDAHAVACSEKRDAELAELHLLP